MEETQEPESPGAEPQRFADDRTIDPGDQDAVRFWAQKLGVSEAAIQEAVRQVGPNSTAVALKLEAPPCDAVAAGPSP
jgi:hypothetical protein